jgi:hypothetical protein
MSRVYRPEGKYHFMDFELHLNSGFGQKKSNTNCSGFWPQNRICCAYLARLKSAP